jgi:hypothetical protein
MSVRSIGNSTGKRRMPKIPKDPRSTGRKRARTVLKRVGRPYKCAECGWSPKEQSRSDTLDANHKNKNILDNDPANLEWLCRSCHKKEDSQTAKGEMSEDSYKALYGDLTEGY